MGAGQNYGLSSWVFKLCPQLTELLGDTLPPLSPSLSSSLLFHSYGEALEKLGMGTGCEKGATVKSNSEAEKPIVGETEAKRGK